MELNDVPDHLSELIPYRCPKCGNLRRFATLRELRQHLETEHSFQMGFVKPHTRVRVFQKSSDGSDSSNLTPRSLVEDETFVETSSKYKTNSSNRKQRKKANTTGDWRESSPLLKSFKEETEILEKELQLARQTEMKHKTQSMQDLSGCGINSDFKASLDSMNFKYANDKGVRVRNIEETRIPLNAHKNFVDNSAIAHSWSSGSYGNSLDSRKHLDPKSTTRTPRSSGVNGNGIEFKSALESLNSEAMKSRLNQWVTSDALYKSQDLLREMEDAAESKCQEQRSIIEKLVQDLRAKDEQIEATKQQRAHLKSERELLLDETETLVRQTDEQNSRLQEELRNREKMLNGLNEELAGLKRLSKQDQKIKQNDLQVALGKIKKLEWERDKLISETDRILRKADADSVQLRQTLAKKNEDLRSVTDTLNRMRSEQQTLLEKTLAVYKSSEETKDIMKAALQTKDVQLKQALKQIEDMCTLHKRLVEQSRILTDQADDNTSSMQRLLRTKASQVDHLMKQLDMLKTEKRQLEEGSASLAEQAESSISAVVSLTDMVKQKEIDLQTTQCELHNLKMFLQSTANKERIARNELEGFIEDLIKRAERAEDELRTLKSQSTGTISVERDVPDEVSTVIQPEDNTERTSLPPKLHPLRRNNQTNRDTNDGLIKTNHLETRGQLRRLQDENIDAADHQIRSSALPSNRNHCNQFSSKDLSVISRPSLEQGNTNSPRLEESGGFTTKSIGAEIESSENSFTCIHIKNTREGSQLKEDKVSRPNQGARKNRSFHNIRPDRKYGQGSNITNLNDTGASKQHIGTNYRNNQSKRKAKSAKRNDETESDSSNEASSDFIDRIHSVDYETISEPEYDVSDDYKYGTNKVGNRTKISRGLQAGQFLSMQNLEQSCENSCNESNFEQDATKSRTYRYDDNDDDDASDDDNDKYAAARYMKTNKCKVRNTRQVTMGKSNNRQIVGTKHARKKPNKKPKLLNHEFDSRYPVSCRSMINIARGRDELSEGEVPVRGFDKNRRSQSLSPRNFDSPKYVTHEVEDPTNYSTDTSICDDLPNGLDVVAQTRDDTDKTDGAFGNIMDENGIMWADEDMDTLPDISDSEFDRVSPSGSEAIATKITGLSSTSLKNCPVTRIPAKVQQASQVSRTVDRNDRPLNDNLSLSNVVDILNDNIKRNKLEDRNSDLERNGTYQSKVDKTHKRHISAGITDDKKLKGVKNQDTNPSKNANSLRTNNKFIPIKSPTENKSSISDRDMTSGGWEVNRIMSTTSRIDIVGASASQSSGTSNSETNQVKSRSKFRNMPHSQNRNNKGKDAPSVNNVNSHANDTKGTKYKRSLETNEISVENKTFENKQNSEKANDIIAHEKRNETLDEKIKRISDKYSPKHFSKKGDRNLSSGIDAKISAISEKYKVRRNDILHGKGVRTIDIRGRTNTVPSSSASGMSLETLTSLPLQVSNNTQLSYLNQCQSLQSLIQPSGKPNEAINVDPRFRYFPQDLQLQNQPGQYQYMPCTQHYIPFGEPYPPQVSITPSPTGERKSDGQRLHEHSQRTVTDTAYKQHEISSPEMKVNEKIILAEVVDHIENIPISVDIERINQVSPHTSTKHTPSLKIKEHGIESARIEHNSQELRSQTHAMKAKDQNDQMIMQESDIEMEDLPSVSTEQVPLLHKKEYDHGSIRTDHNLYEVKHEAHDLKVINQNNQMLMKESLIDMEEMPNVSTQHIPLFQKKKHDKTEYNSNEVGHQEHGLKVEKQTDQMGMKESDIDMENMPSVPTGICNVSLPESVEDYYSDMHENTRTLETNVDDTRHKTTMSLYKNEKRVPHFDDLDTANGNSLSVNSLFAQQIDDDSANELEYDSNTQSYIGLPDHVTDTDLDGDTDTESVRREFFEESNRIKRLLGEHQTDCDNVYRHKIRRKTTSSTSSQASIEIPDKIPLAKREEVKQRRAALLCIFSFLDTWTLTRVAQVCREWRIVSRCPKLWRRVVLNAKQVSTQFLKQVARRCSDLRVLILEDLHSRNRKQSESVEEYQKNIKKSLELGYECILKKAEGTLDTIVVVNCGTLLSAKCLWIASCCCRKLKHVTYLSDFDPINAEVMWALGSGCRDLKTLKCQPILPCANSGNFTTRCVQMIGKCFTDLMSLSVGGLNIDTSALVFVAKQCKNLQYIELHHMSFISCETIDAMCQHGLGSLRSFHFLATPLAPGALTVLIGNCKCLERILIHFNEEDFELSQQSKESNKTFPEYQELIDGYEVLMKQRELQKILTLDVERPSVPIVEKKQQEPKKEPSFFDRWFK